MFRSLFVSSIHFVNRCRPIKNLSAAISVGKGFTCAPLTLSRAFASKPERNSAFKKISSNDISFFKSILSISGQVLEDKDIIASYNSDWMKKYTGFSQVVLRPKTALEMSKICRYCNENNIAITPQGGNTGLVGGFTFIEITV